MGRSLSVDWRSADTVTYNGALVDVHQALDIVCEGLNMHWVLFAGRYGSFHGDVNHLSVWLIPICTDAKIVLGLPI